MKPQLAAEAFDLFGGSVLKKNALEIINEIIGTEGEVYVKADAYWLVKTLTNEGIIPSYKNLKLLAESWLWNGVGCTSKELLSQLGE